jgi:hypothetical protein
MANSKYKRHIGNKAPSYINGASRKPEHPVFLKTAKHTVIKKQTDRFSGKTRDMIRKRLAEFNSLQ